MALILAMVAGCTGSQHTEPGETGEQRTYYLARTHTGNYVDLYDGAGLRNDGIITAPDGRQWQYADAADRLCRGSSDENLIPECTVWAGEVSGEPGIDWSQLRGARGVALSWWEGGICAAGSTVGGPCAVREGWMAEDEEFLAALPTALDIATENFRLNFWVLRDDGSVSVHGYGGATHYDVVGVRLLGSGLVLDAEGGLWEGEWLRATGTAAANRDMVAFTDGTTTYDFKADAPEPGPTFAAAPTHIWGNWVQRVGVALVDGDMWAWSTRPEDLEPLTEFSAEEPQTVRLAQSEE